MVDPLQLVITGAGLDALVNAQGGQTDAIRVASIGLSSNVIAPAPTIEQLPGEFKRLVTISGQSVGQNIIHMTAQDPSQDVYDLRAIGLYLEDGTLFAVYGQNDPIFTKVSIASFFVAFDISFAAGEATAIDFGDALFLYPPAGEEEPGIARFATAQEAAAGDVLDATVRPHLLKAALDALKALLFGRKVEASGLASGGGDLSADRTITVAAASAAEADAGEIADKALTPASIANILQRVGASAGGAVNILASGLASGGGNLTQDRTITVTAASAAEADAGQIATKALTPASIANVLLGLAAKALKTITISGGGLATGGGDLSANRTITVTAASAAEAAAGTRADVALTPAALAGIPKSFAASGYFKFAGGFILQWVRGGNDAAGTETTSSLTYPIAFPNACLSAQVTTAITSSSITADVNYQLVGDAGIGSATVQRQKSASGSDSVTTFPILWILGY